ncbi:tautomerase family protein [Enterococcus thailandicus]|uniref:tautomerase family protein n=1 Tax=Enterococcus thailandicus TaxID=417368 RepID=UPI0022E9249D|nr:tautomerase family protein [Enterococcus thailandicus]
MPVIKVDLMTPTNEKQKEELIYSLTKETHDLLGIPAEKISVVINEIHPSNWGRAGYRSDNEEFELLSRTIEINRRDLS